MNVEAMHMRVIPVADGYFLFISPGFDVACVVRLFSGCAVAAAYSLYSIIYVNTCCYGQLICDVVDAIDMFLAGCCVSAGKRSSLTGKIFSSWKFFDVCSMSLPVLLMFLMMIVDEMDVLMGGIGDKTRCFAMFQVFDHYVFTVDVIVDDG